jgi:hypothetical protein
MRHEDDDTLLRLINEVRCAEHTGILTWDAPPLVAAVESLLQANLG